MSNIHSHIWDNFTKNFKWQSSIMHFRSEKYGKIKNVQVNQLVVVGTRNVDAVFYKSLDNTNILLLDYYNAEIEYEKPYIMLTVHKHLQLIL